MTAHKHAEMIKDKADNMDLVVFMKSTEDGKWLKIIDFNELPAFYDDYEYFLCHQKHEKECLHWLNGSSSQFKDDSMRDWDTVGKHRVWNKHSVFMSESFKFRAKPSKEKRWIVVKNGMLQSNHLFECDNEAADVCGLGGQFIEIEVEV